MMLLDLGLLLVKPFFSYYEITERGRLSLGLLDDLEDDMRSCPSP